MAQRSRPAHPLHEPATWWFSSGWDNGLRELILPRKRGKAGPSRLLSSFFVFAGSSGFACGFEETCLVSS